MALLFLCRQYHIKSPALNTVAGLFLWTFKKCLEFLFSSLCVLIYRYRGFLNLTFKNGDKNNER
jgi:hypothetical protein